MDHVATDEPQAGDQRHAAHNHGRRRHRAAALNTIGSQHIQHRGKRANGVRNIVRTVGKSERRCSKHLHPGKHGKRGPGQLLPAQRAGEHEHRHPHHDRDHAQHQTIAEAGHFEVEVFESLEDHHRPNDDRTTSCQEGHTSF